MGHSLNKRRFESTDRSDRNNTSQKDVNKYKAPTAQTTGVSSDYIPQSTTKAETIGDIHRLLPSAEAKQESGINFKLLLPSALPKRLEIQEWITASAHTVESTPMQSKSQEWSGI